MTRNYQTCDSPCQPIGIGGAALYRMPRFTDPRGSLTVGELQNDFPFLPLRYFIVYDVPGGASRGEHAHKECHQFLICVSGSCRAVVDDGEARTEVMLDRPDLGLHLPPLIWGTQYEYSADAALLVLASHPYSADDYISDYDSFLNIRRNAR